jgi:hypothetical protein
METKHLDNFGFRSFFMNEIAGYLDSYKSDLFLDIATFARIRSNKTVYFFCRKSGSHLTFKKKEIGMYFNCNERAFRFDFTIDKKAHVYARIISVAVTELNKDDYKYEQK